VIVLLLGSGAGGDFFDIVSPLRRFEFNTNFRRSVGGHTVSYCSQSYGFKMMHQQDLAGWDADDILG
jgi:hypothetical protein